MPYYIIDTETTGFNPNKDQVLELATIKISNNIIELCNIEYINSLITLKESNSYVNRNLFNPTVPIHPSASAIHGYTKRKLIGYPLATSVQLPEDIKLCVGHNVTFDLNMLKVTLPFICTMRLAKKIEVLQKGKFGFENYRLFTMFKHFYPQLEEEFSSKEHSALGDCIMTLLVLIKLLQNFPFWTTLEEVENYFFGIRNK